MARAPLLGVDLERAVRALRAPAWAQAQVPQGPEVPRAAVLAARERLVPVR